MIERPKRPDIIERMMERGFEDKTSSPENDEYRRIIYEEQHPRIRGKASKERREFHGPYEATEHIKRFAKDNGADHVAVCRVNQSWVYKEVEVPYKFGIVLLKGMNYNEIMKAPAKEAGIETTKTYMVLGETTVRVGEHVRELGYDAMIHHPRGDEQNRCDLMYVPHAISAGLGEHGRNGILINHDYGPRVRLGMVSTDLELVANVPTEKGIARFCDYCMKCYNNCPMRALPLKKAVTRSHEKFTIDAELCSQYFEKTDGCSICIRDCVFNQPSIERTHELIKKIESWHNIVKANPDWPYLNK